MEQREENHEEIATADVMSMAVKPQRLLNIIRSVTLSSWCYRILVLVKHYFGGKENLQDRFFFKINNTGKKYLSNDSLFKILELACQKEH